MTYHRLGMASRFIRQPIHDEDHTQNYIYDDFSLTAIENWTELRQIEKEDCIVLAKGNWQARLAATILCIAQRRLICPLEDPVCWRCIGTMYEDLGERYSANDSVYEDYSSTETGSEYSEDDKDGEENSDDIRQTGAEKASGNGSDLLFKHHSAFKFMGKEGKDGEEARRGVRQSVVFIY